MQAARWTSLRDGLGYIYSFNGSQSLFIDTMRTLRICCISHMLGHALQREQDERVNLLGRALVAREDFGPIQRLLRRGTRSLRCAGAARAHRA